MRGRDEIENYDAVFGKTNVTRNLIDRRIILYNGNQVRFRRIII